MPTNDPMEAQRVMVIQDASKEVSLSALKWPLRGLCLKPGDMLVLLSIVHEVKNPSMSFSMVAKDAIHELIQSRKQIEKFLFHQ